MRSVLFIALIEMTEHGTQLRLAVLSNNPWLYGIPASLCGSKISHRPHHKCECSAQSVQIWCCGGLWAVLRLDRCGAVESCDWWRAQLHSDHQNPPVVIIMIILNYCSMVPCLCEGHFTSSYQRLQIAGWATPLAVPTCGVFTGVLLLRYADWGEILK